MAATPELSGAHVLVTGASRGIGHTVARRVREAGAEVALTARGEAALARIAAELDGHALPADVSDPAAVSALAGRVHALWGGPPDAVVNAAGAFALAPLTATEPADFERIVAVNLRGPFLLVRAFLAEMLERGSGHLVTIGSVAGRVGLAHNGAYAASKFGVRGLHAVLDVETRGTGVRATLIEAAATDTPLWDDVDRARTPGLPPRSAMLAAEDVAEAVLFALTRPAGVDIRTLALERG